eukprot:s473_g22.t1
MSATSVGLVEMIVQHRLRANSDVLSLNSYISKFQMSVLLLLAAGNAVYRADMWNGFKRKYLLLQTQESHSPGFALAAETLEIGALLQDLHYQAPSTVRQLQRKTLLQFLERTSTDDYGNMLLDAPGGRMKGSGILTKGPC